MFEFAWPWVWLLLPLPLLCYWLLPSAPRATHYLQVPWLANLQALAQKPNKFSPATLKRGLFYSLLWLCFLTAAAQPQLKQQPQTLPFSGRDLLLAIDLSSSMEIVDVELEQTAVTRLALVQQLIKQLIAQRPRDRFGLVFFADQAFLYAPLTLEHHALQRWLLEAQIGLAGEQTAIGDAIGLSIKTLREFDSEKTLLLISDGENTTGVMAPQAAAQLAALAGIKIYAIAVGNNAEQPAANAHLAALEQLAQSTQGQFFHLQDQSSLDHLLDALEQLIPTSLNRSWYQAQPLYHWPLSLGLVLFIGFYSRRYWRHSWPITRKRSAP